MYVCTCTYIHASNLTAFNPVGCGYLYSCMYVRYVKEVLVVTIYILKKRNQARLRTDQTILCHCIYGRACCVCDDDDDSIVRSFA
jgi:hypothetical protein